MYINNLGMRDEINNQNIANVDSVKTNKMTDVNKTTDASKTTETFPSTIKKAVETQNTLLGLDNDSELSAKVGEALERLKSDPDWEDVGTALSALYKNQQQMQVQMNLLSAGYSNSLTGLSQYSGYGYGSLASSAYSGVSNLLGNSIFGNMLL